MRRHIAESITKKSRDKWTALLGKRVQPVFFAIKHRGFSGDVTWVRTQCSPEQASGVISGYEYVFEGTYQPSWWTESAWI